MTEKPTQKVEDIPDPDEDDLDDLDDVLDEFQATSISTEKPSATTLAATSSAPTASGPGRPEASSSKDVLPTEPGGDDADIAAQLQAGMSSLIKELDSNPTMQAEFEKMMQELIAAGSAPTDDAAGEHLKRAAETASQQASSLDGSSKPQGVSMPAAGTSSAAATATATGSAKKPEDFQDTIRKTMERMQASSDTATSAASKSTTSTSEDDLLAQMMKELTDGDGEGGDFNSMLMNMMAHLTNKEILYDPMKELHEKFPTWMASNAGKCSKEDLDRFREQQRLVGEIVGRFERNGYSDENEDDREYIVERMQLMQSQGSPPSDLVGDMSAAQDALGDLDAGCPTQ